MKHIKRFGEINENSKEQKEAKLIIIDQKDPLSKQLKNETGDSYNAQDYKDEQVGGFHLTTHKKTGKMFVVYAKSYYDQVDRREIEDDLRYLKNIRNIVVTNYDGKKVMFNENFKMNESDKVSVDLQNTLKTRENGNEEWMYLDKDIEMAKALIEKLQKKGYHVHANNDTAIFKSDVLPLPVHFHLYSSEDRYRTSAYVSFSILLGKIYFNKAFGKFYTKTANEIAAIVNGKLGMGDTGLAGFYSLSSRDTATVKSPYGTKESSRRSGRSVTGSVVKEKDIPAIANLVFGSQAAMNKAEVDFYKNRNSSGTID